jgi:histone deacetylase 1/2
MGLTMLSHTSMPLKFWDHCFTQAMYLINKTPSSALPQFKSPHMALFNTSPDYSLLKVFGCLCFPHLRPYNRHKFQNRSSPCVYLSVSHHHKGHKCLDSSGRVFISKDVIFMNFNYLIHHYSPIQNLVMTFLLSIHQLLVFLMIIHSTQVSLKVLLPLVSHQILLLHHK